MIDSLVEYLKKKYKVDFTIWIAEDQAMLALRSGGILIAILPYGEPYSCIQSIMNETERYFELLEIHQGKKKVAL